MVYSLSSPSPRARKKPTEPTIKPISKINKAKLLHIKKAICKRKLQEIAENKKREALSGSDKDKDNLVADEEADEKSRELRKTELATYIEEMEKKYEELEEQKHKLFLLLKVVLAEDEKKKQLEMQEKKLLEQKRAEEAAQLALTAPKEEQQQPQQSQQQQQLQQHQQLLLLQQQQQQRKTHSLSSYFSHSNPDTHNRGALLTNIRIKTNPSPIPLNISTNTLITTSSTIDINAMANNITNNITPTTASILGSTKPPTQPLSSPPFTSLVPPAIAQHAQHAQFRHREPLLKDPRAFFGPGFIANPHLTQMAALPCMLPAQVQAQALAAMQLQQGLALPQLLHNTFANPHLLLAQQNNTARSDPRAQRGRKMYGW